MYSFASHKHLISSGPSSSSLGLGPPGPSKAYFLSGKLFFPGSSSVEQYFARKKRRIVRSLENGKLPVARRFRETQNQSGVYYRLRRADDKLPLATADDGLTINSSAQTGKKNDFDEVRHKLDESTQDEDCNSGLVQLLHDTARIFELAIKEKTSLDKIYWFSTAWLGMDNSAWAKSLSYQVSVYSLLEAAIEVSSRDERDRDINVFVQRSMSRHCTPLEETIKDKLLAKGPELYEWCISQQIPVAVSSFVSYFDEHYFSPRTAMCTKGSSPVSGYSNEVSLLMLALSCIAAITKLGPTTLYCPQFSSTIPDLTGRQMDMLVDYVSVRQSYSLMKEIGLRREFLLHFGPRAAACRLKTELGTDEMVFWVGLIEKQLQQAIRREKIWSRLTTSESIEVLGRDLAIFGFFIALGRSTQSFLSANGFRNVDEPIEGFLRYLIGGSVLYYPQLSAISSYQLYVEVVCEELDWLPFYPGISNKSKDIHGDKLQGDTNGEFVVLALDVCLHWVESFIKHSTWLKNPSDVKAARFLAKGYTKLKSCMADLGIDKEMLAVNKETQSFDKALESVEDAVLRLEELLKELHVSNSGCGKEHLKAACSDLEGIRRLKKEAEFLEASFRAKEASLHRDGVDRRTFPVGRQESSDGMTEKDSNTKTNKDSSSSVGFWRYIVQRLTKSSDVTTQATENEDGPFLQEEATSINEMAGKDSNEVQRFEVLRSELMELERRVQTSASTREYDEEELQLKNTKLALNDTPGSNSLAPVGKQVGIIGKSLDKLKETSTDVLQGTQLLAIDTAAAVGLLRRALIGDELTEKEKQALRRTLTDLASVIPIGVLMLLPVTAVGHAAMLAAIQRYMPALIPSTYGQERLDLLRKLQKVRELEGEVMTSTEDGQE